MMLRFWLTFCLLLSSSIVLAAPPLPLGKPAGKPQCVHKIDLGDFGGRLCRFGDLDGDGTTDAVFVQVQKALVQTGGYYEITCITAINWQGKILWQRGKPDKAHRSISTDAPVQIYDFDGDGNSEVLVIEGTTLRVLDGRSGTPKREAPAPAFNCIVIANFSGAKRPGDLLIKDEYKNIWTFDNNLKPLWKASLNTGHYPMNIDIDGDGRDELICGFTLFDDDGRVLWDHPELPGHADSIDADDMDGDGVPEILITCCVGGATALLSADGKILWRKKHGHSQHGVIGAFACDRPGKQAVIQDRMDRCDPGGGVVYCYLKDGTELWHTKPQGVGTIISTVDGWTGQPGRSLLLLYRRRCGPPVLLDGKGRQVAEFPFPPAGANNRWGQYFVQHFDALGDAREEMFVYNEAALWVYTNAAPAPVDLPEPNRGPNPRIYNASFYVGRQ